MLPWGFEKNVRIKNDSFTHCGIDMGDNRVAEWSGGANHFEAPRLRFRHKLEFILSAPKGDKIYVKNYRKKTNHPNDIVTFAQFYVNHPENLDEYSFLHNNCQHFCALCTYGQLESWQTDPIIDFGRGALSFLANLLTE